MTKENDNTAGDKNVLAHFEPARLEGIGPSYEMIVAITTGDIVQSYIRSNSLSARDALDVLPKLVSSIAGAFFENAPAEAEGIAATDDTVVLPIEPKSPAEIKASITSDALISFIDGKPYKMLRRHLSTHGTNPDEYRRFYGLPADYPMTCADYSAQRSQLAKDIGLGQPRKGNLAVVA